MEKEIKWFTFGFVCFGLLYLLIDYIDANKKNNSIIETQKQTIEHLNFIISRHDTTHSKCFKIK